MKKTAKQLSLLTIAMSVAISTAFVGCKKEEGPRGPAGPQGPAGAQGPAGEPGPAGNANVKSFTVFVTGSEWIHDVSYSYITKPMAEITADIVNKGVVMAYFEGDPGEWQALPAAFGSTTGHVISLNYFIEAGKITLECTVNDNVTLDAATLGNNNFKIVTIAGSAMVKNPVTSHRPEHRSVQLSE